MFPLAVAFLTPLRIKTRKATHSSSSKRSKRISNKKNKKKFYTNWYKK